MKPTYESLKIYDLTPIEEHNNILYKRDDKYLPFNDVPLNGGKVRQCATLLLKNYDKIISNECDSLVVSTTSVNSPQGMALSRVAKEFGFRCLLVLGATQEKTVMQNPLAKWMKCFGSEFDYECKIGYEYAMTMRMNELRDNNNIKFFDAKFMTNLDTNYDSLVDCISYQVQNLPDNLDNLVIPTGGGIHAGAIICGLKKYNIKIKNKIYVVQIAGYNRQETLNRIFNLANMKYSHPECEYIAEKTYPYSKLLDIKFNLDGYFNGYFDPIYEAKAYDWLIRNIDFNKEKTLMWIVGNSTYFRTITPEIHQRYNENIVL